MFGEKYRDHFFAFKVRIGFTCTVCGRETTEKETVWLENKFIVCLVIPVQSPKKSAKR